MGAVIQLVAIGAIFVLPSSPDDEQQAAAELSREEGAEPDTKPVAVSSNKKGRKDKSARRRR